VIAAIDDTSNPIVKRICGHHPLDTDGCRKHFPDTAVFPWGEACEIEVTTAFGPDLGRARCLQHESAEWLVARSLGADRPCEWLDEWPYAGTDRGRFYSRAANSTSSKDPFEGTSPMSRMRHQAGCQFSALEVLIGEGSDPGLLEILASHWHPMIFSKVAGHPLLPPSGLGIVLRRLSELPNQSRYYAVRSLGERIAAMHDEDVEYFRLYIMGCPSSARWLVGHRWASPLHDWLLDHVDPLVRRGIAQNPSADPDALDFLSHDRDWKVARAAAHMLEATSVCAIWPVHRREPW
jgi:hypothetical protein